jgi:Tol biopolymer transport system component
VEISKDRLFLIFSSNRATGNAGSLDRDLYLAQRVNTTVPWSSATVVPITDLNTVDHWDSCPALSLDGHRLYFTSSRDDGCNIATEDIWVSRRHDKRDYLTWEEPVHIDGCGTDKVNSTSRELAPAFFEDESGRVIMYFASNRTGNFDFYQAELMEDGSFGPATPVVELNTPTFNDQAIAVRRDGLEVIFGSNRPTDGSQKFWTATRESTSDPWSSIVELVDLGIGGGRIALSADGRELYFTSSIARPEAKGSSDIYMTTREKLKGKQKNE